MEVKYVFFFFLIGVIIIIRKKLDREREDRYIVQVNLDFCLFIYSQLVVYFYGEMFFFVL